jgi:SAM-dependent methyltransferase
MNRYPQEYSHLKSILEQEHQEANSVKKILSFGCATGDEPLTLAQQYFEDPSVKIFGVDVADYAIEQARMRAKEAPEGKITILDGREVSPKMHGPFEMVLANSVFCIYGYRHVDYKNVTYVMETFPFATFEAMLHDIDSYLKIGGILAIHNSNYNFMDTLLAQSKYEPLSDKTCPDHFVPRIDRNAKQFINVQKLQLNCLYRKTK